MMHDTVQAVLPERLSDPGMETFKDDSVGINFEESQLIALGHKPELKRTHTFWSLMAYQTTILCSWSCNIVMFYYVFTLGGPVSLVWGTYVNGS
jgi:choline transport protein